MYSHLDTDSSLAHKLRLDDLLAFSSHSTAPEVEGLALDDFALPYPGRNCASPEGLVTVGTFALQLSHCAIPEGLVTVGTFALQLSHTALQRYPLHWQNAYIQLLGFNSTDRAIERVNSSTFSSKNTQI